MGGAVAGAELFHRDAGAELAALGFHLEDDPVEARGNFRDSAALYRSQRGFCLSVGFSPQDSGAATVSFGRQWWYGSAYRGLSNYLFVFCQWYGLECPQSYALIIDSAAVRQVYRTIVDDLERTLPRVLERLTRADLEEIELAQYGTARHARRALGDGYLSQVVISEVRW